jgi:uncharacterized SAM-binding protein YcdF (DUF218 family)
MNSLSDLLHFFRSILPVLLMPPEGLIWLILIGLAIGRFRRRSGVILAGLGLAGLYALSMPIVGGSLIASLESRQQPPSDAPPPGAIIVLGADGDHTLDMPDKAAPGPLSLQRLATAAALARKTNLPVLITGGNVGTDQPPIADLMAEQFNDAFGLQAMWRETRSYNTCENARFSAAILRRSDVPAAYLVTHAWHMPRSVLSFERAGYPVIPAPVYGDAVEIHGVSDFLPHANAWLRSYFAIHEWIGLIAYHLGACPRAAPAAQL